MTPRAPVVESTSIEIRRYTTVSGHACPQCQGELVRTGRRTIDRLTGLFAPTHRYRCHRFRCQWEGNLPVPRSAASRHKGHGHSGGSGDARADAYRRTGLPASFVTHMVLAVVGVVVVVVLATTDPLSLHDEYGVATAQDNPGWVANLAGYARTLVLSAGAAVAPSDTSSATATPSPR